MIKEKTARCSENNRGDFLTISHLNLAVSDDYLEKSTDGAFCAEASASK